jgi:hypothetical protein
MRLFSWLHFADLHFGEGSDPWSNELLLACLREDAAAFCSTEGRPDAIFVTGGVVSVRPEDERDAAAVDRSYELARIWLSELGRAVSVPPARIFIVPGSSDIRPAGAARARSVIRLIERLRDGAEAIDDAIADGDDRALLLSRLAPFTRFAEAFGPSAKTGGGLAAPPLEGAPGLSFSTRVTTAAGLPVRVVGLTTGLLSGSSGDRGRLRVGVGQLGAALRAHADGELLIVLSSHPFHGGWLADEQAAAAWLESRAPIHLTACADEDRSVRAERGPERGMIRVAAGLSGGDIPGGRCYNLASVGVGEGVGEGGSLELRVWHRRWSRTRKAFVADVDAIPSGQWFAAYPLDRGKKIKYPPRPIEARPEEELRDDFRARSELLEARIRNAVAARGPEAAREAARLLEKELHRYVASVDDDLKRARAEGQEPAPDLEAALHAEIRDLRKRARRTLARVKLAVMLDAEGGAAGPPAPLIDEREVFACSGDLVALGAIEDIGLLRRAEERWKLDFLTVHRRALEERTKTPPATPSEA